MRKEGLFDLRSPGVTMSPVCCCSFAACCETAYDEAGW